MNRRRGNLASRYASRPPMLNPPEVHPHLSPSDLVVPQLIKIEFFELTWCAGYISLNAHGPGEMRQAAYFDHGGTTPFVRT
jgi:hypothetical protein